MIVSEQEREILARALGRIEGKTDSIERTLENLRSELRRDIDAQDARLLTVQINASKIEDIEKRLRKLEEEQNESADQLKSILLRYVLPISAAGGGGAALTSLLGG